MIEFERIPQRPIRTLVAAPAVPAEAVDEQPAPATDQAPCAEAFVLSGEPPSRKTRKPSAGGKPKNHKGSAGPHENTLLLDLEIAS